MNKADFDEMDPETQEILDRLSPAPEKLQEEGWNRDMKSTRQNTSHSL